MGDNAWATSCTALMLIRSTVEHCSEAGGCIFRPVVFSPPIAGLVYNDGKLLFPPPWPGTGAETITESGTETEAESCTRRGDEVVRRGGIESAQKSKVNDMQGHGWHESSWTALVIQLTDRKTGRRSLVFGAQGAPLGVHTEVCSKIA